MRVAVWIFGYYPIIGPGEVRKQTRASAVTSTSARASHVQVCQTLVAISRCEETWFCIKKMQRLVRIFITCFGYS